MKKQYSMFVRDLKYQTYLEELEEIFVKNDIMNIQNIDSIVIRNLDLDKAYTFLQYDIKNNAAKHIHKSV
jgi:phage anti-repressor protein